jgi:hypothetical protein
MCVLWSWYQTEKVVRPLCSPHTSIKATFMWTGTLCITLVPYVPISFGNDGHSHDTDKLLGGSCSSEERLPVGIVHAFRSDDTWPWSLQNKIFLHYFTCTLVQEAAVAAKLIQLVDTQYMYVLILVILALTSFGQICYNKSV